MRKVLLALMSWALISSAATVRDVEARPQAGANELQGSVGFFHENDTDEGFLTGDVSYGVYLSPGWQVGFRQALNYNFIDDGRDVWTAVTSPFLNYHFRVTDIIYPYLGGFVGAVWNDRDITGTIGPQAGVKLFVHESAFVNIGYRYEWFWDKIDTVDDNTSDGNHIVGIGIGFVWGGR
jgi:opacity protein-like surface antigen